MRVALLTTDAREPNKQYAREEPYFGTAPEALLEGFQTKGSQVEVHVLSCLQRQPKSSPTKLADNIYYHSLRVPKMGWLRTGYQGCIRAVRHKLTELQPDIVHGQGTERDCGMSAVCSGFPNVLTIHGNMRAVAAFMKAKPLSYYWLAARLERFCLCRTAGVVCISTYTQAQVSRFAKRTWLLPNAVHSSFFSLASSPASPARILCVANVDARKNQIQLMKALDFLHSNRDLELRFVGAGSSGNPYFTLFLSEIAQRPWCSYLGSLDRPAIQSELQSASIAVLPSLEDNCPMVVLEAAAAGVPVAASRVGGIPDLVRHQETGLLFNPSSEAEIREAVGAALSNSERTADIAERARVAAKARFAPAVVARAHLDIYRDVLNQYR
jgi:glycosyltransferase involved in cell wall biosynthesis